MSNKKQFSTEEARSIGTKLEIDWSKIGLGAVSARIGNKTRTCGRNSILLHTVK